MTRIKIGDLVEISTREGFAYAQYINRHRSYGALLRVFRELHQVRPPDLDRVLEGEVQFVCVFPLQSAVSQRIVHVAGNGRVPAEAAKLPVFRNGVMDPRTGKVAVWWFWDGEREWKVGSLTEEQKRMPLLGCWNDTLLSERIVAGWRPEQDPTT